MMQLQRVPFRKKKPMKLQSSQQTFYHFLGEKPVNLTISRRKWELSCVSALLTFVSCHISHILAKAANNSLEKRYLVFFWVRLIARTEAEDLSCMFKIPRTGCEIAEFFGFF